MVEMSWPKILIMELSGIDEFTEPEENVVKSDCVIGEASEDLKRIYTFAEKLRETGARYVIDARFSKNTQFRIESKKKLCEIQAKIEAVMAIFWITLRDNFDLWDKEGVGIRKGWKVVYRKSESQNTLLNFLNNF